WITLPRERLKIGTDTLEAVDRRFLDPGEITFHQSILGNSLDPGENLRSRLVVAVDLEHGALARIDADLYVARPAGIDYFGIKNDFQEKEGGKIAAGNPASRYTGFPAAAAFKRTP